MKAAVWRRSLWKGSVDEMGRLLRFENRKLFRQVSFYVCLTVLALIVFLGIFSTYSMMKLLKTELGKELEPEMLEILGFQVGFSGRRYLLTALGSNNLTLLLGIFIALFICSDYVAGTAKNVIGRGFSRGKFIAAKEVLTLAGTGLFCLVAWGTSFVLATAYWGAGTDWSLTDVYRLAIQFVSVLAYAAFFSFLSFLFKKSGAAIALNIMAPVLVSLGLSIVDIFTKKLKFNFSDYWLANCLSVSSDVNAKTADLTRCGITAGIYVVVFVLLTHLLFSRRDVS